MLRSPTAAASTAASMASSSSRPTSTMGCSGLASHASLEPKPARRAVMLSAPGMCASSNCSSVRTSTTSAPSCWACSTCRGLSGCASTVSLTSGPRLSATMFWKFGGCGPSVEVVFSTNSSSSVICSSSWLARSNPMVEETLRSMPGPPHSEPPRCPGHTSTVSGRLMSLSLSEWKMPRAPSSLSTARSGRAMSPTNSVSPLRTAHGSSARAVSMSANAVCSGRCPGVCSARTDTAPSSSSQPSSNGSWS